MELYCAVYVFNVLEFVRLSLDLDRFVWVLICGVGWVGVVDMCCRDFCCVYGFDVSLFCYTIAVLLMSWLLLLCCEISAGRVGFVETCGCYFGGCFILGVFPF